MKLKYTIILLFLGFCISGLYSCKTEPVQKDLEELSIRIKRDPSKLNPIIYPSSAARELYSYILVPIADFNPETLELEPILIKEIPEAVSLTDGEYKGGVRFDLEFLEEAKWDDGSEIDGDDLVFTLKTVKCKEIEASGWRAFFEKMVDIQVDLKNKKKVSVTFSEPYMLALESVVTVNLYPKHVYDPTGATDALGVDGNLIDSSASIDSSFVSNFNGVKHSRDVVQGAGPYKLTAWETDQYVILERKENYWAEGTSNPYLQASPSKMIFKVIPDETSALALLQDGEIDLLSSVTSANFEALKEDYADKFTFLNPQLIRFYYLALNNKDVLLADPKVRKALAHCTDVDQMIQTLENGYGNRQNSIFHSTKSYADRDLKGVPFNLKMAAKELEEAGWSDTDNDGIVDKSIAGKKEQLELDFLVSKSPLGRKVSMIMQQEAKKVGIKINLVTKTRGEIAEAMKSGNFHASPSAITSDPNDDDPFNKWHTNGPRNYVGYSNSELDMLIDKNRLEIDRAQRIIRYQQMQEIMAEDYPVIFLYSPQERMVVAKNLNATATPKRPGYLSNTFSSKETVPSLN